MPTTSPGRPLAIDTPLSPEQEDRLAALLDELSETRGAAAQARLEALAAAHPDLAGQLRELFAAMSMVDAGFMVRADRRIPARQHAAPRRLR
jgi:hypothetical protein